MVDNALCFVIQYIVRAASLACTSNMAKLIIKICLIGGAGTGKSCIAVKFIEDVFNAEMSPTIGAAYLQKDVETKSGSTYHLQLWDTAGQERYKIINLIKIVRCIM